MMGVLISSDQIIADQSPTVRKFFGDKGVPLQAVDRAAVPGPPGPEGRTDTVRRALGLAVTRDDGSLLCTHHELGGPGLRVVLEDGCAQDGVRGGLFVDRHGLDWLHQATDVPEVHFAVRGAGH